MAREHLQANGDSTIMPGPHDLPPIADVPSTPGNDAAAYDIFTPVTAPAEQAEPDLDGFVTELDCVGLYLARIGRHQLLTAAEEVTLSKRIEAGLYAAHKLGKVAAEEITMPAADQADLRKIAAEGTRAKDEMLQANLRLVVSVARRFVVAGTPLDELIGAGNLGLIRAVEKFDYTKGFKFSTYAMSWIKKEILEARNGAYSALHFPAHRATQHRSFERADRKLSDKLGRQPTDKELSEDLGLTIEEVKERRFHVRRGEVGSLHTPVGESGELELGDIATGELDVSPEEGVAERDAASRQAYELHLALNGMTELQREIMMRRYGLGEYEAQTINAVAKAMDISRDTVARHSQAAMRHLRENAALAAQRN